MSIHIDSQAVLYPNEPSRFSSNHLQGLLVHAIKLSASDITIQTDQQVFAEIQGQLYRLTKRKLSNTEVSEILNDLYGPNGTAQLMSGKDLDTSYELSQSRNERYRFRVNATGIHITGHEAIQITIRTIPSTPPTIDNMHLPEEIINAIAPKDGVIYVTGPTGSGKTTLLASIMRFLTEQPEAHRKVLTYESPIEFVYDYIQMPTSIISQTEIPTHLASFAAGVRNALRRKPHAILVGESRDPETIIAVLEAALTGHPVYTTLHTNGVAETIRRLVGAFPSEERTGRTIDIVETVRLIIWQQLAPTVDGGRVPLREYLIFNEEVRDRLLDQDHENITASTRGLLQEFGRPMIVDVEEKFKQGIISKRHYEVLKRSAHARAQHKTG